jgi:hypothetical protein
LEAQKAPRTSTEDVKKTVKLSFQVVIPARRIRTTSQEKKSRNFLVAVEIPVSSRRGPPMETASLPYEVLDLALDGLESSALCRNTMTLMASAKRIIVVVGAGISVATGIPDFRSSTGLFSTLKADTKFKPSGKALFDASVYKVTFL